MNTEEVAKKVVELTRKQAWHEAVDTLYDKDIVSVEASGMGGQSPEKRGIEAVRGKADWWINTMQVHCFKVSGPFVAHDRFVAVDKPSEIPVPRDGDGIWIHPAGARLHAHIEEPAGELKLQR